MTAAHGKQFVTAAGTALQEVVWGCGPDARLRKRADRLRGALWQAGWGGLCLAAGFSRVGQGRAGFAAAEFPPAPPARAATARQRDPEVGEHREKLGKLCLLTPSARAGRMGPQ